LFKESLKILEGKELEILNTESIIPTDAINFDPSFNMQLTNQKCGNIK
jgi:hypothetical protein